MGAKKREILATVRSSNGKKHYDITRKPDGQLDCSCMSQRFRTFGEGATCCKHLKLMDDLRERGVDIGA